MWGNLAGWIIAGVLFICISAGAYVVHVKVNQRSEPTKFGLDEKNLAPLDLAVKPTSIVSMSASGDAGEAYRRAIDDVLRSTKKYETFIDSGTIAEGASLPAVKAVLEAAPMAQASILMRNPSGNIGYFDYAASPELVALDLAGRSVERIGLLHNAAGNKKEALRHFEASFALGAKMFNERVIFMEAFKGIGLMNGAAEMMRIMARQENDEARIAELEAFLTGTKDVTAQLDRMWKVVNAVGGTPQADRLVARHAGDIFHFASPAMKERMWRVEATLKLGRFKYNVGGPEGRLADHTAAVFTLDELETDSDPAVKAAAQVAKNLTLQDFRLIK